MMDLMDSGGGASDTVRALPHAIGPEKSVLSSILQDASAWIPAANEAKLTPEHFYLPAHATLYELMLDMADKGQDIELVSLVQRLLDLGQLDRLGGPSALTDLYSYAPSPVYFKAHIKIIKEKFLLRQVVATSNEAITNAYDEPDNPTGVLDALETNVAQMRASLDDGRVVSRTDVLLAIASELRAITVGGETPHGLHTGYPELDRMTGGLKGGEVFVVAARPSMGKAQPLWSKVLTPSGFVPMGDLNVGDMVVGLNGKPTRVVGVFPQGELDVYKVNISDGSSTHACGDHLWLTETRNERRSKNSGPSVKTTKEIAATINRQDGGRFNHDLPEHGIVDWGGIDNLPLDPWLLGALIGDGKLEAGNVCFFKPEQDLCDEVASCLPDGDSVSPVDGGVRVVRRGTKAASETRRIINDLRLNVPSTQKFIPHQYLMASPYSRARLLCGLIDTDGSVVGTSIEYSTSSSRLAHDFVFLARSLGVTCSMQSRMPKYTYKGESLVGQRSFRIFMPSLPWMFSSHKHTKRYRATNRREHRSIASIVPVGKHECQCIMVDAEDSMYITDDFIPTHNTAIMMNIVENVCVDNAIPTLVFSLEMDSKQLHDRMIYGRARYNPKYDGIPTKGQLGHVRQAFQAVKNAPLYVDDTPALKIHDFRSKARSLIRLHGIKLIAVDYLQLMRSSSKQAESSREREVSEIMAGVKALAKEEKVPIIMLCQLNRSAENRTGNERGVPRMSDLRESGSIEQDADLIGLLYRKAYYASPNDETDGQAQLDIAKNRNGQTGKQFLTFVPDRVRFEPSSNAVQFDQSPATNRFGL